ncbi:MAG: molybdopterin oxidoreductase, molybdopterin binding subunit [Rhodospirillaceae bacterium]|jgi:anaerobic selenocysteine-containing dehydrogenase|nr:molybdopterin oxidoreductase, molybdopterin binding subunit [Rhodospirillaceae bacterium]MDP6643220.1 molybdopterin-dependent oxidoreductase [Rhodospirillales bacterium]
MNIQHPVQNSMKPGKWIKTSCKMCLFTCNMRVLVSDDGVVIKVEGEPSSVANGSKLCTKGNAAIMRHYDPNRFKSPLRRTNPEKGPGVDPRWEPISWDEAYALVAAELKKTRDEDPRKLLPAIGYFHKGYLRAWPAVFGTSNIFSSLSSYCGGGYHSMNGFIHSTFSVATDVNYCDYWLTNGSGDGFSSHMQVAAQAGAVADARVERNMRVVCVEPRLSVGGAKAEEWVPIRPATDRFFALGLCQVMIADKLYDEAFLKKDTNAPYLVGEDGYFVRDTDGQVQVWDPVDGRAKAWNDATIKDFALEGAHEVAGAPCRPGFQLFKEILEDCTPEQMSEICTVPADTIRRIAREFAKAARIGATIEVDGRTLPLRPASYIYYRGASAHKYATISNHAFKMVNMLVGNIDAPGGHVGVTVDDKMVDRGHVAPGADGLIDVVTHPFGPPPAFSYPPNESHLEGYFPFGWIPGHLNHQVLTDPDRFDLPYRPDTVLLCHANPIWSVPGNRETWFELLRSMRFMVAIDIIPNDTNIFADVILPGHDFLESWNMLMNDAAHTEGMSLRQPVCEPLYDTKSDEEIFYELAERLGFLEEYNDRLNRAIGFDMKPDLLLDLDKKYTDKEIARRKGLLWNGKDLDWYAQRGHSVTPRRPDKWYRPWEGMRLRFYIEDIVEARDDLKGKMDAAQVPIRGEWEWQCYQPLPVPLLDPVLEEPEEFDLYAISFKEVQLNFAETLGNPWLDDVVFRDPVHTTFLLNAKTGAEKGLKDGDVVRMESPYGNIFGRVSLSQGVHPETVCVSNALTREAGEHTGVRHGGGHFNELLPADLRNTDACSSQPETVARVKIIKLSALPGDLPPDSVFAQRGRL